MLLKYGPGPVVCNKLVDCEHVHASRNMSYTNSFQVGPKTACFVSYGFDHSQNSCSGMLEVDQCASRKPKLSVTETAETVPKQVSGQV